MKILVSQLDKINKTVFEDDIVFKKEDYEQVSILRSIENCHVCAKVKNYVSIIEIELHIVANMTLVCSYTLQDVPYTMDTSDVFEFSNTIEDEEIFAFDGNEIDLDELILGVIIGELPLRIRKEGAELPSVDGVRIMSEDEVEEERKNTLDPRLKALDDFEE